MTQSRHEPLASAAPHGGGTAHPDRPLRALDGAALPTTRRAVVRRVAALGGAAAVTPALAACAGPGRDGAAAPPAQAVQGKISYTAWGDQSQHEAEAGAIKLVQTKYPQLSVDYVVQTGNYDDTLQTLLASGSAPDVFWMRFNHYPASARRGALAKLDTYQRRDQKEIQPDDFVPTAMANIQVDGSLYGLPLGGPIPYLLMYNKDLFAEAGQPLPTADWTWNDLLASARRFVKTDGEKRTQWGFNTAYALNALIWAVWSNGGDMFSADAKRGTINQPAALEALDFWQSLRFKERVAPIPEDVVAGDPMREGKQAMTITWASFAPQWKQYPFKWDVAMIPFAPRTRTRVAMTNVHARAVNAQSKNPEGAWQLVKHLVSREAELYYFDSLRVFPARKSVLQSDELKRRSPVPNAAALVEMSNISRQLPYAKLPFGFSELQQAVAEQERAWGQNRISTKELADGYTATIDRLIQQSAPPRT